MRTFSKKRGSRLLSRGSANATRSVLAGTVGCENWVPNRVKIDWPLRTVQLGSSSDVRALKERFPVDVQFTMQSGDVCTVDSESDLLWLESKLASTDSACRSTRRAGLADFAGQSAGNSGGSR